MARNPVSQTTVNYRKKYESGLGDLIKIAGEGDASELARRMQERADYNKPILEAQMKAREGIRDIDQAYNWVDNPGLKGLSMSDRDMLRTSATASKRQEERTLGAYYTARQEDLASAITAWKDAWQAKYNAAKEGQQGYKDLYGFSSSEDSAKESAAQHSDNIALARWKEQQANARNAASIAASKASNTPTVFDQIDSAINEGMGWGSIVKLMENNGYPVTSGGDADMYLRYRLIGPEQLSKSGEKTTLQRMYDLGLAKKAY